MKSQIIPIPEVERFQNESKNPGEEELKIPGGWWLGETVPWADELTIVEIVSIVYSLCFCDNFP